MSDSSAVSAELHSKVALLVSLAEEHGGMDEVLATVERLNAGLFTLGQAQEWDGWPVIRLDIENHTISIDIEGWSKGTQ